MVVTALLDRRLLGVESAFSVQRTDAPADHDSLEIVGDEVPG
jgi:hypothetical protein